MNLEVKETEIQNAICEYLAVKRHFFWRSNNTGVYDPTRKIFRAMPKYAKHGVPDIIVIRDGFFIGLEVKTPKGRLSEHQKTFHKECKEVGGEIYTVRSIDDVINLGL